MYVSNLHKSTIYILVVLANKTRELVHERQYSNWQNNSTLRNDNICLRLLCIQLY